MTALITGYFLTGYHLVVVFFIFFCLSSLLSYKLVLLTLLMC